MKNRNSDYVGTRLPLPTNDVTRASQIVSVSAEAVTLAAGGANTTGSFVLSFGPIASSLGDLVGKPGDTSLSFSGELTTEVTWETIKRLAEAASKTAGSINEQAIDYTTYLTANQYYVVYETGRVYYKKGSVTTAITANYKYRADVSSGSGGVAPSGFTRSQATITGTNETNGVAVNTNLTVNGLMQLSLYVKTATASTIKLFFSLNGTDFFDVTTAYNNAVTPIAALGAVLIDTWVAVKSVRIQHTPSNATNATEIQYNLVVKTS